jgi:UDP-N-acetylglucosamine diphosphorylase/glucosamine-1-phosphate N-acetyltransferase
VKRLYLYDDAKAREFEPFALTRPVSELRAGAELIRLRWERVAGGKAYGFIGSPHLAAFEEMDAPPAVAGDATIPAGSLIVNSRFVVALDETLDEGGGSFVCDGSVCAVRLQSSIDIGSLADGTMTLESLARGEASPRTVRGRWLREVWDLVGDLITQLGEDIPLIGTALTGGAIENAMTIGKHRIWCEVGSRIEPYVVLDASEGPILIRRGATISPFTRIVGPCYIGEDSHVAGDAIRACSIGNVCKVRGEISTTVMLGHSNKGHTGFVGNSYLGRWVNLGAGTTTSNLKNTYGPVSLMTPSGVKPTGLQFLGTLFGDHAKLGIGSLLTTGCVVGAGANIYGGAVTPKSVPPFAWGECEPWLRNDFSKFCEVAERMMARRHVVMTERMHAVLQSAFERSAASRA